MQFLGLIFNQVEILLELFVCAFLANFMCMCPKIILWSFDDENLSSEIFTFLDPHFVWSPARNISFFGRNICSKQSSFLKTTLPHRCSGENWQCLSTLWHSKGFNLWPQKCYNLSFTMLHGCALFPIYSDTDRGGRMLWPKHWEQTAYLSPD